MNLLFRPRRSEILRPLRTAAFFWIGPSSQSVPVCPKTSHMLINNELNTINNFLTPLDRKEAKILKTLETVQKKYM